MKLIDDLTRALTGPLDAIARRRCHQCALNNALAAFESNHYPWIEASFDLKFLTGRGAEALEANDAQALARAWTSQFRYRDEARRDDDVRRLVLAAATFLELFKRAEAACAYRLSRRLNSERDARTFWNPCNASARRARLSPSARGKERKR